MEPKKCASPFIEKHLPAIMTVIAFSSDHMGMCSTFYQSIHVSPSCFPDFI